MKVNKQLLIQKLEELKAYKNVSYREMGKETGVHNISRIVSGEIKNPTPESWLRLHNAYPKDIPEPVYIQGGKVYKNVANGNGTANQAKTMTINNELAKDDNKLTPEEMSLIRLIRTKADPTALCVELIVTVANRNDN